jgi:hypothetical protein
METDLIYGPYPVFQCLAGLFNPGQTLAPLCGEIRLSIAALAL